ncbi:Xyloglucan fucosyltransferase/Nodulation protein Z NodZ [Gigaspora margarita]|uniref:Xyloglucan fucosyltransferase/Nodulation protein Z NodZ n=1 Tax=Gigaspora margarita TaxID=4874 RepID=A0A8H3XGD4_GIGMA|nr:Xyloglucan fucosyltransferase/Nodulation protein Z NodZ [Gigaspora margarita]
MLKYMIYILWILIFSSLTFLIITSNESYSINDLTITEKTANHINIENENYANVDYVNIESVNDVKIENLEKATNHAFTVNVTLENVGVKKYSEAKYSEFDIVYNEYVKKHNRIIAELLNPSNLSELPKVVVVIPDMKTGYGNRLPGIVCGFLYSLITDRLFFIWGYNNFEDYYEKDFNHNWNIVINLYKNTTYRYMHYLNQYNDFSLVARENLSNEDISSHDILYVYTWDYACAPITSNPYYKKWFDKIIPDYKVFTTISLKLLRLHPNINKQVETFAEKNFSNYAIGIHLREKKLLDDMIIPVEHYSEVVKMLTIGMKNVNISIFVAAGSNNCRTKLINSLRKAFNHHNNNSINIVYTEENMDLRNPVSLNPVSEVGALIDMKLLSLCDDLVITYSSSFGFIAAGWSQKASRQRGPFVIMPVKDLDGDLWLVDKVWMWGAMSSEPCMYLSKQLIENEDEETVKAFKTNPLWMHFSQCHWYA